MRAAARAGDPVRRLFPFSFLLLICAATLLSIPTSAQDDPDEALVIVAETGSPRAARSADAATWEDSVIGSRSWQNIAHSPSQGRFVAVGSQGWFARSSDGLTWSETQLAGFGNNAQTDKVGIVFAEGIWVATANEFGQANCAQCIATSEDAVNWTFRSGGANDVAMSAVGHNGTGFLTMGNDGATNYASRSDDGLTWTQTTMGLASTADISGIAWGASRWVAVASSTGGAVQRILVSNLGGDVTAWNQRGGTTAIYHDVVYGDNRFCTVGVNTISRSTDGLTWTTVTFTGTWRAVEWVGSIGAYVAISEQGDVATSDDCTTWERDTGAISVGTWMGMASGLPTTGAADGVLSPDNQQALADSLGIDLEAAAFFLGIILVAFLAGGAHQLLGGNGGITAMFAVVGIALAFVFGLFPLWFLVIFAVAGLAIIAYKTRGFFQGGGA